MKMDAMPIDGKNLQKSFFFQKQSSMILELSMDHLGLKISKFV